jgi:hypothetical protein
MDHATELKMCFVLLLLFALVLYQTWIIYKARQDRAERFEESMRLKTELERRTPSEFCLRDIVGTWQQQDSDERLILVKFRSSAGLMDFFRWVRREHQDAGLRARAEANGRGKSAHASKQEHT